MATCTWDWDSGTLTTQQEKAEEKNCIVLETASWFKNSFADLGSTIDGKLKKPAPLPKTLFNLEKDQSVKMVHHHHKEQQTATTAGNTPPRKGKNKIADLASSDGDSTTSSSQDRPRAADAVGDEDSPTSSAEDGANAVGTADGG